MASVKLSLVETNEEGVRLSMGRFGKAGIVDFIEASLRDYSTRTVNISVHMAGLENLERVHQAVLKQNASDNIIDLPRQHFIWLGTIAGVWIRYGFEHVLPDSDVKFEADCEFVYAFREIFDGWLS